MSFASKRTWVAVAGALVLLPAGAAPAQLPVAVRAPPVPLPPVGGVIGGVTGTVGGIVGGVPGAVDQAVGTVLGGGTAPVPGAPGAPGGSADGGGPAGSGALPADTVDSLLATLGAAGAVTGDGSVVVDGVAPTARVRVLSRLTQIARTASLRIEVASDEAGVVAVGGAVRPGGALRGRAKGHSRRLVKWPTTVLGFRGPGRLRVTIKLSRAARIALGRSRNARMSIATIAADAHRNQRRAFVTRLIKR
jgi:hypothetical protein